MLLVCVKSAQLANNRPCPFLILQSETTVGANLALPIIDKYQHVHLQTNTHTANPSASLTS
jgi:hypothetical protein